MTLKERFESFEKPEYYSRVDSDHILELYIGLLRADFSRYFSQNLPFSHIHIC